MLKRFNFHKFFQIFLFLCIFLQFFQVIFAHRSLLITPYDAFYWQDRVEHSQWVLPLSQRTIGDDGLFAYVGYTLAHGTDPSLLNPETGPVGKYLFGFSSILLGNPYYVTLFFGIGSALFFFLICDYFFQKKVVSLFTTFLFVSDPLFASQFVSTSLDILQVFFLLFAVWMFLKSMQGKKNSFFFVIFSGLAIGLFSEIKFPLLTPFLVIIFCGFYLLRKQYKYVIFFILGLGSGLLIPYIQYFHLGHSVKDFLKLQKYIIAFYSKSGLTVHHEAIWDILFLGKFPDVVTDTLSGVHEWWVFWPISVLFTLNVVVLLFLQKKKNWILLSLGCFSLISVFLFSLIPVYTRYLLLILPLFYLFFVYDISILLLSKIAWQKILFGLCIIGSVVYLHNFLIPSPQPILSYFFYNMSHGYFQDIYAEDIGNTQYLPDRQEFRIISQKAFDQAQIQEVSFHPIKQKQQKDTVKILGDVTYTTRDLGKFTEKKTITMQKIDGAWKVMWDWNNLFQGFQLGDSLITHITVGKRGIVTDQQEVILAQDRDGYLVQIKPSIFNFQKEIPFLQLASRLSGLKAVHIQNAYLENPYQEQMIPLFTSFYPWDNTTIATLAAFPGVSVIAYPSRMYTNTAPIIVQNSLFHECCTQIYSSTTYQGITGFEKKYNSTLKGQDGGSLVLVTKGGKILRTLITQQAHDGENITVPL